MEKFEQIFSFINNRAEEQIKAQEIDYLEALLQVLEDTLDGKFEWHVEGATKEDMRKAIQIAILKGMRKSSQPNHQMTPDTLGLLVSHFVEQCFEKEFTEGSITVADLALGTGNLLYTVMNALDGKVHATGVEVDDLLIRLAAATGDLIEQPVTLYRQDALEKLLIDPVDAVICDLPVGFYPNEEVALDYEVCTAEGLSYAHHLFIEQSMNYTKEGGYGFFLIPANLFETEQAKQLHKFIKEHAWIQAVIQLPENLFSARAHEKSILILQKQSAALKAPREVLLAKVPNMSNRQALAMFFEKVRMWKEGK
ncbi:class I SAM-dependent methyltransferase [Lysinibacillus sp. 2017]|uniref:class I SAM-dependent methyltransferase n=1 Tax=unclassified Lysinibacillus TaxID=2636778 RepID=UPI000D526F0D|nr:MULTISPECIES: class I SAM-dependent methyltransferase [unclassified Lysinibacillus]AWE08332.1 class I SAM-dependent methyltransferase [Lysinibacillus sp. 2017]TGN35818.1 class I SAM-dependent methyltransferase [Lysinibacillus sp. S2017]